MYLAKLNHHTSSNGPLTNGLSTKLVQRKGNPQKKRKKGNNCRDDRLPPLQIILVSVS